MWIFQIEIPNFNKDNHYGKKNFKCQQKFLIEFNTKQTTKKSPSDCEIRKLIFYSTKECLFNSVFLARKFII